jgi:hypothetical protein
LLESPLGGVSDLVSERCSELSIVRFVHRLTLTSRSLFEALKLRLDTSVLVAGTPHCRPIHVRHHAWCCSDGLQHPLGRIGASGRWRTSLTNKVVYKRLLVCTNVTEVDRTSACNLRQCIEADEGHAHKPLAKSRSRSKRWNRMADGW